MNLELPRHVVHYLKYHVFHVFLITEGLLNLFRQQNENLKQFNQIIQIKSR